MLTNVGGKPKASQLMVNTIAIIIMALCVTLLTLHATQTEYEDASANNYQIICATSSPEYNIKPCKSLKIDLSGIPLDKLKDSTIEVRAGKLLFYTPYVPNQTKYELNSNLIAESHRYPFAGFEKGIHYWILIKDKEYGIIWSVQIYVSDYSFWQSYFYSIETLHLVALTAGSFILGVVLLLRYNFTKRK